MSKDEKIKTVAASYVASFDFHFKDSGAVLALADDSPDGLQKLILDLCGNLSSDSLIKVYEALNTIIESDAVDLCEIDEKICKIDLLHRIVKELEQGITA